MLSQETHNQGHAFPSLTGSIGVRSGQLLEVMPHLLSVHFELACAIRLDPLADQVGPFPS